MLGLFKTKKKQSVPELNKKKLESGKYKFYII